MAYIKDEKKCGAIAGNTGFLMNSKIPGSPYCWHHQAWKTTLMGSVISLLIGAIIAVNVLSTEFTEKEPRLFPSLNWQQLAAGTVFVYPTNATYPSNAPWVDFTFSVHNAGDMDANAMFMRLTVHSYISNFIHAPKWNVEEAGGFGHTDQIQVVLDQRGDPPFRRTQQPSSSRSYSILVESRAFGGFCEYGSIGAKTKRARLHVFFNNPEGITNIFRDQDAREYLRKLDRTIADNPDTVTMKFILESTNEVAGVKQGNSVGPNPSCE